jgi:hypothetical protein
MITKELTEEEMLYLIAQKLNGEELDLHNRYIMTQSEIESPTRYGLKEIPQNYLQYLSKGNALNYTYYRSKEDFNILYYFIPIKLYYEQLLNR